MISHTLYRMLFTIIGNVSMVSGAAIISHGVYTMLHFTAAHVHMV